MKRLTIIIVTLVFVPFVVLAAESRIKFDTTEIDFGTIDAGKVVNVEFKFKNTGDETLIIKNINSSCGCTVPKLEKKEYQPGETGVIPVKFFSKGNSGKVVKTITLTTNDIDNVYTILKIKGTVELKDFARMEVVPEKVDFKAVKMGEEYSRSIKIKNTGTSDLRIIEVTHSPEVSLRFDRNVAEPGKDVGVKIIFTPMQNGRFASFMRIRTNAHMRRTWIVKVSAEATE
jgi:hypothetical protein